MPPLPDDALVVRGGINSVELLETGTGVTFDSDGRLHGLLVQSASVKTNFHQFLDKPRVYADLNGGWQEGDDYIVPLNSTSTELDVHLLGYTLKPGLVLDFWTDDGDDEGNPDPLVFQGKIGFDEGHQKWYAVTRKDGFHHASDLTQAQVQPVRSTERELTAHTR